MTAASITKMLHSRTALMVSAIIAVLCTIGMYAFSNFNTPFDTEGFVRSFSCEPPIPREVSTAIECVLNLLIVMTMVQMNKTFNLLRSFTQIEGAFFLLMQLATPAFLLYFSPGTLLCLVVLLCMWLIFQLYGQTFCDTRPVFLVFAVLSACASFDYCYAVYIPVFMAACIQLRIFSLRTFSAIMLGIITPWIIFIGFGIVSIDDLQLPRTTVFLTDISSRHVTVLVVTAALTCFVTFGAWIQNVIKILTYNAYSRALQSVISLITLVTMAAVIVNSANINYYLPLLNCCCALQLAHLFGAIYTFAKSYIAILSVVLIYLFLLLWKVGITYISF